MGFFKSFSNKPTPKEVAKDRLKLILIHDRGEIAPNIIEKIREEILDGEKIEISSASVPKALTVLPLRDIIIFPNMFLNLRNHSMV